MTSIGIAILIFVITGTLGWFGKKMVNMVQVKARKHKAEHEFVCKCQETAEQRNDEHQLLMVHMALLIESNISQIGSRLLRQHKEYMSKDSISANEFKTWHRMYKSYSAMGGNGFITKLNEEIETLTIEV